MMVMLSGKKRVKKGVDGGEAACDYSAVGSVTITFFWNSQWKGKFPGEAHVRIQGE